MKSLLKILIGKENRQRLRFIQRQLMGQIYSLGNVVMCPICTHTYSRFLPFNRPNALCPHCRSLERHRLLFLYLKNKTDFFSKRVKLLHFAPEKCLHDQIRKYPNIHYTTADLMTTYMDAIGVAPDLIMSVSDIQFPDQTFDVVICNHVFELVPDDAAGMKEIYRVIKPGGYAIIQSAVGLHLENTIETSRMDAQDRIKFAGSQQHLRRYGRDYPQRLANAGFDVEINHYVKSLNANRFGLMIDENIYICHKR